MKAKPGSESFEESYKISESFNFPESENQKQLLSSDFVFKFEDNQNQIGSDLNDISLGDEDNKKAPIQDDNAERIKEEAAKGEENISESTSSTSSASTTTSSSAGATSSATTAAASASSTVAAVAATTTSAVVLVVGGGIAIYGQTVDKPNICEFNQITVVENRIDFTLSLGNDQLKIDNGEENTECDIKIELKCPSMEDFEKDIQVSSFGKIEGQFADLEYDTEYLLNVSQYVMLSSDSEYLLDEPISVTTEKKKEEPAPEPEKVPQFYLYEERDPMGTATYSIEVNYKGDIPEFEEYYICMAENIDTNGIHYADGEPSDEGANRDWIVRMPYDVTKMGRQPLSLNMQLESSSYYVALVGMRLETEEETEIVGEIINKDDYIVEEPDLSYNRIFFQRQINSATWTTTYNCYLNVVDDTSSWSEITGIMTNPEDATGGVVTEFYIEKANEVIPLELNFGNNSEYIPYQIEIECFDRSSPSDDSRIKVLSELIDFGNISTNYYYQENSIIIYREVNPMGGGIYYADVDYQGSSPASLSYYVVVKLNEDEEATLAHAPYDMYQKGKQYLTNEQFLASDTYYVSLTFIDDGQSEVSAFSVTINAEDIIDIDADYSYDRIFFQRVYEETQGGYEMSYQAYFNKVEGASSLSNLLGYISDPMSGDIVARFGLDYPNKINEVTLELNDYQYSVLDVKIVVMNESQQEVTLLEEQIDFSKIATVTNSESQSPVEPQFLEPQFVVGKTYLENEFVMLSSSYIVDPDGYWSDFQVTFYEEEGTTYDYVLTDCPYNYMDDYMYLEGYSHEGSYETFTGFSVSVYSTYNEENQRVTVYSSNEQFSFETCEVVDMEGCISTEFDNWTQSATVQKTVLYITLNISSSYADEFMALSVTINDLDSGSNYDFTIRSTNTRQETEIESTDLIGHSLKYSTYGVNGDGTTKLIFEESFMLY